MTDGWGELVLWGWRMERGWRQNFVRFVSRGIHVIWPGQGRGAWTGMYKGGALRVCMIVVRCMDVLPCMEVYFWVFRLQAFVVCGVAAVARVPGTAYRCGVLAPRFLHRCTINKVSFFV